MGKYKDKIQATWDIRTLSTSVDPGATTNAWIANIDADSEVDYSGNKFPLDNAKTFDGKGGQTAVITWPAGGNPILKGSGGEDDAKKAIDAFVGRDMAKPQGQQTAVIKITGKAPAPGGTGGENIVGLVLVLAAIYFADR